MHVMMLKHGYCLPSQRTVLKLGCYVDLDICCISRWRKDSDHFLNTRTSRLNLYSADCLFSSVRCRSLNYDCESKILVWHCALFWVCLSCPVLYLNNKAYVIEGAKKHYHELVQNAKQLSSSHPLYVTLHRLRLRFSYDPQAAHPLC